MLALDLFCGAGGSAVGLWRSGLFERIVGVDFEPQPDYPFDFVQAEVLEIGRFGDEFHLPDGEELMPDFVWASPPCQAFSNIGALCRARNNISMEEWLERHPNLIDPVRELLAGHDWTCMENVPSAPIRPDIILEGGNVGIPNLARRRHFEVSWTTLSPQPYTIGPATTRAYGRGGYTSSINPKYRSISKLSDIKESFGVDWTDNRAALNNMVPPAYATYIIEDAVRHGFGNGEGQ